MSLISAFTLSKFSTQYLLNRTKESKHTNLSPQIDLSIGVYSLMCLSLTINVPRLVGVAMGEACLVALPA